MIEIDKLYIFKTIDKSPYVFIPDEMAFNNLIPDNADDLTIHFLSLVSINLITFSSCMRAYLDYDVNLDFEQHIPFTPHNLAFASSAIYNYRFKIIRENPVKAYENVFNQLISKYASDVFQIVYHTINGNWFICYAEFEITNTTIDNNIIQSIEFQASDAKEEKYLVDVVATAMPG